MKYAQFCPIAKASEVLGEKWTLLIIRELCMGGTRFNTMQRGLGSISPTLLNKRLKELVDHGIVTRKKLSNQKGYEYFVTDSGRELFPILVEMGKWGMRWARDSMSPDDLDLDLLLLYLERSVDISKLPGDQWVMQFTFSDITTMPKWWLVVDGDKVETCIRDPGKTVDIYFQTDLRTMTEVWMGDQSYAHAIKANKLAIVGPKELTSCVSKWLSSSIFAGIKSATASQAAL